MKKPCDLSRDTLPGSIDDDLGRMAGASSCGTLEGTPL